MGKMTRIGLKVLRKLCTDKVYLSILFKKRLGYRMDWKNPKTFNQKLQWMKLYDRNPRYTEYADKYTVRGHIAEVIGEQYLIPLIGVYNYATEIDFDNLPNKFALKCNHGAGYNIICKDKSRIDVEATKKKLDLWLATDFYKVKCEYHYKNIPRRIICEEFLEDEENNELNDYKFFCIGGKVQMIQVDYDRYSNHRRNIYDKDWNLLDLSISFPNAPDRSSEPPRDLCKMIELAEILSKEFAQVRIDFYYVNHKIYFGEMTFFSGAGFAKFTPRSYEEQLGQKLVLNIGNGGNGDDLFIF